MSFTRHHDAIRFDQSEIRRRCNYPRFVTANFRAAATAREKGPRINRRVNGEKIWVTSSLISIRFAKRTMPLPPHLIHRSRKRERDGEKQKERERKRISLHASGKWRCDLGKGDHLPILARQTGQLQVAGGRNSIKS